MQKHIKSLLERNAYVIAVFITLAIAYLSLTNPSNIAIPIKVKNLDKFLHASAYTVLTLSWLFALRNYKKYQLVIIPIFLYGILMEFLQGWLTINREKDIFDVLANSTGILLGMLIFTRIYKVVQKKL